MSETPADPEATRRRQLQRQAEQRLIVQATLQARRAGKMPKGRPSTAGADALTALLVIAIVVGMLVMAIRYGT